MDRRADGPLTPIAYDGFGAPIYEWETTDA